MTDLLQDRVVAAIGHLYQVESEIGRGGMSVVYRARDPRLNRLVAIKVLPPELAYDPAVRTRFTREAQTSAQLSHPHIVPIFDVGDRDGIAYFVMAFVNGGNLATLLGREPQQPLDEVRRLLCEVADALAYAHLHGVVHRDVKPDNILLDANTGRALVTDFGIARAMEGGSRLTVTGIAVGTPTYMSPEQAEGDRRVDGRSDIYSLGVLGYQMLTGRVPFSGGNTMALLLKHVTERPRPIAELRPDTPRALREAVERALQKSPEDRWPTAAALRDALLAGDGQHPAWRTEPREPVRYTSPVPGSATARRERPARESSAATSRRGSAAPVSSPAALDPSRRGGPLELEPPHLAPFTPEQRRDIRLWHGRIHLLDRIKAARGYAVITVAALFAGFGGMIAGLIEGVPPAILAPVIPLYMARKLWHRGRSLRAAGVKLRRVFLLPRAKWVIPQPPAPATPRALPAPSDKALEKLASRETLASAYGATIRRAAEDRAAILDISGSLPKADRELLPDLKPTVNGLVERVAQLAHMLHRLDESIDPRQAGELDARIAQVERDSDSPEGERRLALLRRQRETLHEISERHCSLSRQLDNAGLALGNLRLDLVKLRSSGLQSALSDVTSATQEARALSREIGMVLEAAADVRAL